MSASEPVIAVIDHGAGNLVSIDQALRTVGATPRLARHADDLEDADAIVMPGVGAAGRAMHHLEQADLIDPVLRWIKAGRPYLGICLGLQLLFDCSDEDGADTLGVFDGRAVGLVGAPTLPHIGWNQVERRREHPIFDGIADGANFYFVHSYAGQPRGGSSEADVLAETSHGLRFVSAIARGNVVGVQFHPERSGTTGWRLLANYVRWAVPTAATAADSRSGKAS